MSNNLETGLLDHPVRHVSKRCLRYRVYLRLGLSLLRTLQTNDKWDAHVELLSSLDDALSNVIASHDT